MNISPLINKVISFIKNENLIERGDNCLLAVSGGFDSVALLDIIYKIKNLFSVSLGIAHVNYNLRENYSIEEEKYVKELAENYNLPFYLKSINLKENLENESLENFARDIRYSFFEEVSIKNGFNKILVAHNANDQAETVLLKLIRGSVSGLKGIEPKRKLNQTSLIDVIRPILCLSRYEIENYCKDNNLKPKTDLSNLENNYRRNRVRNKILPLILDENPNFLSIIQQTSNVISQEDIFLENIARNIYQECLICESKNQIIISDKSIKTKEEFLRRRVFKIIFKNLTGDIKSFSYKSLEAINESIKNNISGKLVELAGNYFFIKDRDYLIFSKGKTDFSSKHFSYKPKLDKYIFIDETKSNFCLEKITKREYENLVYDKNTITFSLDNELEAYDLSISNYSGNIKLIPYNKNSELKLKEFLDKKNIPEIERKNLNLVFINNQLLWVSGIIRTNIFPVEITKDIYKFNFLK